jgi:hypothetical protein
MSEDEAKNLRPGSHVECRNGGRWMRGRVMATTETEVEILWNGGGEVCDYDRAELAKLGIRVPR